VLILEPPRTRYDLHFRLAGFPVRIHPAFWLLTAILGFNAEEFDAVELLLWVVVVFVSILVHELGHALLVRRFGWVSRIILYHLGGLATIESPQDAFLRNDDELSPKAKILTAAAGPLAGFVLAAVLIAGLYAAPIHFGVTRHSTLGLWFAHDYDTEIDHYPYPFAKLNEELRIIESRASQPPAEDADEADDTKETARYKQAVNALARATRATLSADDDPQAVSDEANQAVAQYARHRRLGTLIDYLLYVNIFWGLINLLPVFPLDGGQIARELLSLKNPRAGTEKALLLSAVIGGVVAVVALWHFGFRNGLFFALMFGLLAFINYRLLQQIRQMGGYGGGGDEPGGYEPEDWWKR
jgi:Zn-dependent protease